MAQGHRNATPPRVLLFPQNDSVERMIHEVCVLEGIESVTVHTADQAFGFLASADGDHHANGRDGQGHRWVVLMDNLQVHSEGQAFLRGLRDKPGVRARLKSVCIAIELNCRWALEEYGDVLDDYLVMPFDLAGLLDVIGVGLNE